MADEFEASVNIVAPDAGELERAAEAALRPKRLSEFVGQKVVRDQLQLVLDAARARGASADHVLLAGPPGLGKTTLAMIIAAEMGTSLRLTSGPAIQHAGDLAAILSGLQEGDVLFIDEIHRLARTAEEMLYLAMEDFRVDVVVGKGQPMKSRLVPGELLELPIGCCVVSLIMPKFEAMVSSRLKLREVLLSSLRLMLLAWTVWTVLFLTQCAADLREGRLGSPPLQ